MSDTTTHRRHSKPTRKSLRLSKNRQSKQPPAKTHNPKSEETMPSDDEDTHAAGLQPVELKRQTNAGTPSARRPAQQDQPTWRSCCFQLQPQAATFTVQVLFSAFLMMFAAWKLSLTENVDALWVSLLTSTVGIWLPSPIHNTGSTTTVAFPNTT